MMCTHTHTHTAGESKNGGKRVGDTERKTDKERRINLGFISGNFSQICGKNYHELINSGLKSSGRTESQFRYYMCSRSREEKGDRRPLVWQVDRWN